MCTAHKRFAVSRSCPHAPPGPRGPRGHARTCERDRALLAPFRKGCFSGGGGATVRFTTPSVRRAQPTERPRLVYPCPHGRHEPSIAEHILHHDLCPGASTDRGMAGQGKPLLPAGLRSTPGPASRSGRSRAASWPTTSTTCSPATRPAFEGEVEVASFELASGGCGRHVAFWLDRLSAVRHRSVHPSEGQLARAGSAAAAAETSSRWRPKRSSPPTSRPLRARDGAARRTRRAPSSQRPRWPRADRRTASA